MKVRRVKVGPPFRTCALSWRARTCKGQAVMFGSVPPYLDLRFHSWCHLKSFFFLQCKGLKHLTCSLIVTESELSQIQKSFPVPSLVTPTAQLLFPSPSLFCSPHVLMLLSPLHSHCDSGGQARSNLSQMSLKNTSFLRRLLSPLTKKPIISLSNHRADFWGLPARLHMHCSRQASKTLLSVIYNDMGWLCCCHLSSPHHRLLGSGSDPDSWHLLRI